MDAAGLLTGQRIVPVVLIEDAGQAVSLARCLIDAGLGSIEVTLRSAAALAAIERIAAEVPEIIVGAGSLRKPDQVADVEKAGARFAVAPGATDRLLDAAEAAGVPFLPGAATASEMMHLHDRGYALQKFFPAERAGGIPYLQAVGAPLPEIRFVPTGGITAELARDYLALDNVFAVGGSWITPASLLRGGDFDGVRTLAKAAARLGM